MTDASSDTREWTQVDLIGPRGAVVQRILAAALTVTGLVAAALSLPLLPDWWAFGATLGTGILVLLIGVSLWISAGSSSEATTRMRAGGRRVDLPVVTAEETTDDMERFRLTLLLPVADAPRVDHHCHDHRCVLAGRELPGSTLPAMIDESRRVWGVIHGPIDR